MEPTYYVGEGTESVQEPINSQDEGDVARVQVNRVKDHHQSNLYAINHSKCAKYRWARNAPPLQIRMEQINIQNGKQKLKKSETKQELIQI